MKLRITHLLIPALSFLLMTSVMAQDSLGTQGGVFTAGPHGGVFTTGGKWQSAGSYLQFSAVGQMGVSSFLLSSDSSFTGTVGIVAPVVRFGNNERPVAVAPDFAIFIDETLQFRLEGYDPDGDAIEFLVSVPPDQGTVQKVGGSLNLFEFTPSAGLSPEVLYSDQLTFVVREVVGGLQSEEALVPIKFQLSDQPHSVESLTKEDVGTSSANITLTWIDTLINNSYSLDVSYYDLTDPAAPVFRNLLLSDLSKDSLTISDGSISHTFSVNSSDHPYLFSDNKVFATAFVGTPNGNSDFDSYVFENGTSARVGASEDGLFFAFGSPMTVTENRSVALKLIGVDLSDAGIGEASVEIISNPYFGTITTPVLEGTTLNARTWDLKYSGTQQVGGKDSVQFRIFNPDRQMFDTAWVRITIVDVNDPPKITALEDQLIQEDQVLNLVLDFLDPDSEVEVLVESNEASSVPVSYADNMLQITPVTNFSGLVSINVIVQEVGTDEEYVAFDRFNLEIEAVNDPPVVSAISDQSIEEDNSLVIPLSATDVDSRVSEFDFIASVSDPSQIDVTIVNNTLQINPKANVSGSFDFEVKADDRLGLESSRSEAEVFTLDITQVNDPPVILKQFATQKIVSGLTSYSIDMKAYFTDVESAGSLEYSITGNSAVSVAFTGSLANVTIGGGFNALEEAVITASDGEFAVEQNISFLPIVQSADIQTTAVTDVTLDEDFGSSTLDISAIFSDANNVDATFTYSLLGNNFVDASVSDQGIITFTSSQDFNGEESLVLVGTTADKSNFTEFVVTINPVNDAPVAGAIADLVVLEDKAAENIFVQVSDIDNNLADLTIAPLFADGSAYQAGDLSFTTTNGGWLINIVPPANYSGSEAISLVISDGDLADTVSVTLEVQPVNDVPYLTVDALDAATEDQEYSFDLAPVSFDVEEDVISYSIVNGPEWISLSGASLSGVPTNQHVGSQSLTIRLEDEVGGATTKALTIEIANTNDAPELVAENADISVLQESEWTYSFPESSFLDVDASDQLTYSFESVPDWATVSGTQVTGNPQYEDLGNYEMILTATDQSGATASDTLSVTVEFTVYDVAVEVTEICDSQTGDARFYASGGVTHNWYDQSEELILSGKDTLTIQWPYEDAYYVEGVDAQGRTTPDRIMIQPSCARVLSVDPVLDVQIYPNPTSEVLTIETNRDSFNYQVYDILGKSVNAREIEHRQRMISLDVSELRQGVYLLKYADQLEEKVFRFIVH